MERVYIRLGQDIFSVGIFEASYGWSGKKLHPRTPFNRVTGYNGKPELAEIGSEDYKRLSLLFGDGNEIKDEHVVSEKDVIEHFNPKRVVF